jgi:hypothetical protein
VPLVAAFDVVLGNVSGDIGRRLHITARARFPSRMCRAVHDRLIVGGVLASDAAWLFERASKRVSLFASPSALLTVTGQRAWVPRVRLKPNLGFITPPCCSHNG